MNILIKIISSIFYFFPSLRQQGNPITVECGVFRGDPFIHPFFNFFVIEEVCVRVCVRVASIEKDGNPTMPNLESMLDAGGFKL